MTEITKTSSFDSHLEAVRGQRDIYQEMLLHKRSPHTKRAYASDMKDFFCYFGMEPTPITIKEFLSLTKIEATALVLKWKNSLVERGLKMSSISRKVGSVKSFVKFSNDIGACEWLLTSEALVCSRGIQKYRDTTGVSPEWINKMLLHPDRSTLIGKRDYAILQLLWSNALRRAEVVSINLDDWDGVRGNDAEHNRFLWIMGKGRADQERITLNPDTIYALKVWLDARFRYVGDDNKAMFISLDRVNKGGRLRDQYVYTLVNETAKAVGLPKKIGVAQ